MTMLAEAEAEEEEEEEEEEAEEEEEEAEVEMVGGTRACTMVSTLAAIGFEADAAAVRQMSGCRESIDAQNQALKQYFSTIFLQTWENASPDT